MSVIIRWCRLVLGYICFGLALLCVFNHKTAIYLAQQAWGQFSILKDATGMQEFMGNNRLSEAERHNILLIEKVKKFSVESLSFVPTDNFTTIYNQRHAPVLWVITASRPFSFDAYLWQFPIVGKVSYKGFFRKELAQKEFYRLHASGYDVDLRSASAWSTLGWFKDPLMSNTLQLEKGNLCNLLFHELFHATYYADGSVDLNENLANFVAHKATLLFLAGEPRSLKIYQQTHDDETLFNNYMLAKRKFLEEHYKIISTLPQADDLKTLALIRIADSIKTLPFHNRERFMRRKKDILKFKNAYFVDFQQYDSKQDSLEKVFNKIYKASLKNLVQSLRANKINY